MKNNKKYHETYYGEYYAPYYGGRTNDGCNFFIDPEELGDRLARFANEVAKVTGNGTNENNCNHNEWIYEGQFFKYIDFKTKEEIISKDAPWHLPNLQPINRFTCTQCGKHRDTNRSFECFKETHIVISKDECVLSRKIKQ